MKENMTTEKREQRENKRGNARKNRLSWLHHIVTLVAVFMMAYCAFNVTGWADALYDLAGSGEVVMILNQDGMIQDLPAGRVYEIQDGNSREIAVQAGQKVVIRQNDAILETESRGERLSVLLDRMQVMRAENEMVAVDLSDPTKVTVIISERIVCLERELTPALYAIERRLNPELPEGKELVVQEGQDGAHICVYETVWMNGERVEKNLIQEVEDTSIPRIIEYGGAVITPVETAVPTPSPTPTPDPVVETILNDSYANGAEADIYGPYYENNDPSLPMDKLVDVRNNGDGSGVLVFASGRTARFKGIKSMSATAYNKDEPKVGTITASGTTVHKGVVAVDRKVIPLGTRLYVVAKGYEYGYSVAEDTGVFGNTIDLYFESYRGMQEFGRRAATVYILE